MSSMQWIDNSIDQIKNKLDHLKETHNALREENDLSYQKTYDDPRENAKKYASLCKFNFKF